MALPFECESYFRPFACRWRPVFLSFRLAHICILRLIFRLPRLALDPPLRFRNGSPLILSTIPPPPRPWPILPPDHCRRSMHTHLHTPSSPPPPETPLQHSTNTLAKTLPSISSSLPPVIFVCSSLPADHCLRDRHSHLHTDSFPRNTT